MPENSTSREHLTRARFIGLGTALGVGAAGASVIAACGGDTGGAPPTQSTTVAVTRREEETTDESAAKTVEETGGGEITRRDQASGDRASNQPESNAIANEADVAPGSAIQFTDEAGGPAVLVHLAGGDFVAYSAVCTHAGCTVAYGGGQLACPCHGSVFDPASSGAVVNGPAQAPLPQIPVQVRNGQVVGT